MARKLKPVTCQMLNDARRALQRDLSHQVRETLYEEIEALMHVATERVSGELDKVTSRAITVAVDEAIERQVKRMVNSSIFEEFMFEIEAIYDEA